MNLLFDRFKNEMTALIHALDTEMKKENPMPYYLFAKIEAIERQVRILKSNID